MLRTLKILFMGVLRQMLTVFKRSYSCENIMQKPTRVRYTMLRKPYLSYWLSRAEPYHRVQRLSLNSNFSQAIRSLQAYLFHRPRHVNFEEFKAQWSRCQRLRMFSGSHSLLVQAHSLQVEQVVIYPVIEFSGGGLDAKTHSRSSRPTY